MSEGRALLAPRPAGELDEAFWRHCAGGRLCFQRCRDCGAWRHLPRPLCPGCGSASFEWAESSGRGRIFSWTVTHRAPHPGLADRVPYTTVIVELEEGVRLVSAVRGLAAEGLALDLPVRLAFERLPEGGCLPVFEPAPA